MKSFSLVPTSEGPRCEFKITWGLRAGYGPSGWIYDLEETIRAAHRWTREPDARAEPFLSGMLTRGEVVFAGSETEAAHEREPVAISTGEVLPHYVGGAKGRLRVELRCSRTTGAASSGARPKYRLLISTFPSSLNRRRRDFRSAMRSNRVRLR
jgi:hypothetical protein